MRKLLMLALILPFCALALPSHASADSSYTVASLTRLLVTGDELTAALGPGLADVVEITPGTDPISVGRAYTSTEGEFININLFSPDDGAALTAEQSDFVLSGEFIQKALGGFSKVTNFEVLGQALDRDMVVTFVGTAAGVDYNVSALSFVRGNIFGIVMYSTPGENDSTVLGMAYGAQLAKLP